MDKRRYELNYIGNKIVCEEREKGKFYNYEEYVVTKNNERFKYSEWIRLVKEQAERAFELDILETLTEFLELTGYKNTSERKACEIYAAQAYKEKICHITYQSLELFHQMMNKKVEQISLF